MAIYNVTTHRHGGTPEVHGVDAEGVEIGQESANGDRDSTLRFTDVNGDIVAAFYDWEWFTKSGVEPERIRPAMAHSLGGVITHADITRADEPIKPVIA